MILPVEFTAGSFSLFLNQSPDLANHRPQFSEPIPQELEEFRQLQQKKQEQESDRGEKQIRVCRRVRTHGGTSFYEEGRSLFVPKGKDSGIPRGKIVDINTR